MNIIKVLKVSLIGAFLGLLIMYLSVYGFIILREPVPFSYLVTLWILSFIIIGALGMKLLKGSQDLFSEVLISDILTSVWIVIGVILILAVNSYQQTGRILDFLQMLAILLPFVLFGPPVTITSIVLGSVGYYFMAQKKAVT